MSKMKVKLFVLAIFALTVGQSNGDLQSSVQSEKPIETSKCPKDEDPTNPTVLPYPGDCSKFYKCLHGRAYPVPCPPGLHWSNELNRCDWPEVAKCDPNVKAPTTEHPAKSTPTSVPSTTQKPSITTEGPIKHPLCPENEDPVNPTVLPHPSDCSKFYKCLYGRAYPISCIPGLHWSTALKRCDWPDVAKCNLNAKETSTANPIELVSPVTLATTTTEPPVKHPKCPKNEDPKNPTFLPYPKNCSKFYKCKHGLAIPLRCPSGLHWNIKTSRCDWPNRAGCDPNIETIPTERPDQSTPGPSTTLAPPVKHRDCPKTEDPAKPTYLPYPKDCSKFYKCLHGFAHLTACPSGLHWSKKLKRCDWPEAANCDPNIKPTTENPVKTTTVISTTEAPIQTRKCPNVDDPARPVYLPYPGDCTKFYKCMNSLAHAAKCPSGLHWNSRENQCDWPEVAKCDPKLEKKSKMSKTVEEMKANGSKKVGAPCRNVNELLPHKTDCTKFIQCSEGHQQEKPCPLGTHFNAKLMICDHPQNARCDKRFKNIVVKPDVRPKSGITDFIPKFDKKCLKSSRNNPILFSHPKYCEVFYRCYLGMAIATLCPRGTHWNDNQKKCDLPERANCKKTSFHALKNTKKEQPIMHKDCPDNYDLEHPAHLPYPNDCTKFYKCLAKMAYPMDCPPGLHWSIKFDRCDWPSVAKCTPESSVVTKTPQTTLKPHSKVTPTPPTPSSTSTPIASSTSKPATEIDICKKHKDNMYLPHPKDCAKYVQCYNGKDHVNTCPSGLQWNQNINNCDYPANVKCNK